MPFLYVGSGTGSKESHKMGKNFEWGQNAGKWLDMDEHELSGTLWSQSCKFSHFISWHAMCLHGRLTIRRSHLDTWIRWAVEQNTYNWRGKKLILYYSWKPSPHLSFLWVVHWNDIRLPHANMSTFHTTFNIYYNSNKYNIYSFPTWLSFKDE